MLPKILVYNSRYIYQDLFFTTDLDTTKPSYLTFYSTNIQHNSIINGGTGGSRFYFSQSLIFMCDLLDFEHRIKIFTKYYNDSYLNIKDLIILSNLIYNKRDIVQTNEGQTLISLLQMAIYQ